MNAVVWIGSLLGLAIGSLHAVHLYRRRVADARESATASTTAHLATAHLEGAYYGLWALALWVIFGTYVLVLWVIGAVAHSIFRLFPRRRAA
jgi:glycerol uptake facilitator-like aquaporin